MKPWYTCGFHRPNVVFVSQNGHFQMDGPSWCSECEKLRVDEVTHYMLQQMGGAKW